jgi:U4/U6.U5 tri-snRNP-associated protein 1
VRNKRELHASLQGSTLGDADADTDDALKWIKRSKKREKELAKKRQAELESMDKVFQDEYTESKSNFCFVFFSVQLTLIIAGDLEGLKVSHDLDQLEDGESHILTLKDSRILDNEGSACCHPPLDHAVHHLTLRGRTPERRNGRGRENEGAK